MTTRYLKTILVGGTLCLSACAQQTEVHKIRNEISDLSQNLTQLNQQTSRLAWQNSLNANSTHGVYLLPGSDGPARLISQSGTLQLSLRNVVMENGDLHATLIIMSESGATLPTLSGKIIWGQLDGTPEHPLETEVQIQQFTTPIAANSREIYLPIALKNIATSNITFIRIHDIRQLP